MISREELQDYAKKIGFNLYQAEKDYLQHAFLAELYSVSSIQFVFKGGTALQKAYGLDRFSEDLDFTFNSEGKELEFVRKAAAKTSNFAETALRKEMELDNSASAKLKMKGPLYDGREITLQTVTIEISTREKVQMPPLALKIVPPYADLKPYVSFVMAPEEILAEKVRALTTRHLPRDLYDLWFLLRKNTKPVLPLINKKLEYCERSYDFSGFKEAVEEKRRNWTQELKALMKTVPDFDDVSLFVIQNMPEK